MAPKPSTGQTSGAAGKVVECGSCGLVFVLRNVVRAEAACRRCKSEVLEKWRPNET